MSESAVASPEQTPVTIPAPEPAPIPEPAPAAAAAPAPEPQPAPAPPPPPAAPAPVVTAAELVRVDNAEPGAQKPPARPWSGIGRKPGSKNKPKLVPSPQGELMPKALLDLPRPGAAPGQPGAQPGQSAQPGQGTAPEPEPIPAGPDRFRQSAESTFDGIIILATMLIGQEWQPRSGKLPNGQHVDEREQVVKALEKYYRTKNIPELPPWLELAMAAGVYSACRLREQNTRTKMQIVYLKVKGALSSVFGRLFRRKRGLQIVPKPEPGGIPAEQAAQELQPEGQP